MRKLNPDYLEKIAAATNKCPYFSLLSMRIREIRIGHSVIEIDLAKKHLQPLGLVHGGAISSVVDAAAFWAVFAEVDEGMGLTTVDLKINFLAPATTGMLTGVGRCIKLGKTLGLADAQVTDQDGRIVAHGTSTLMLRPDVGFDPAAFLPPKFLE